MDLNTLQEVLSQGVSLQDLLTCMQVCKEWNKTIKSSVCNTAWRLSLIDYLSGCHSVEVGEDPIGEDEMLPLYDDIDWHKQATELLSKPFVVAERFPKLNKIDLSRELGEAMSTYDRAGGVIEWWFYKPHDLFYKLYWNNIPAYVHEMAVIASIGTTIEGHSYELLQMMRKPRILRPDYNAIKVSEISNPTKGENDDILPSCSRPPYGMRFSTPQDKERVTAIMEKELYSSQGYGWIQDDENPHWADFWRSGNEWWGTHCVSHYSDKVKALIVSAASTTD